MFLFIEIEMQSKKKVKSNAWRPTLKTEIMVNKLLDGFRSDFTVEETCAYAWISKETFYQWIRADKQLADDVESARAYCFIMAKNNVRKWLNEWDKEYSLKWLKNRQNKIYSERNVEENKISWEITISWVLDELLGKTSQNNESGCWPEKSQ